MATCLGWLMPRSKKSCVLRRWSLWREHADAARRPPPSSSQPAKCYSTRTRPHETMPRRARSRCLRGLTPCCSTNGRWCRDCSLPAWKARLLSRTTLRSSPKHHLVDPSLAAAAVGASADALFNERTALGLLLESMALRDLRVYAQANRSTVFHYRDKAKLEVDAVVERDDGRWIAAEVKLGAPHAIEEAAQALLALRAKVDTSVTGPPRARRRHLHGAALHESRRRRRNAAHRNAAVAIQPADCRVRASGGVPVLAIRLSPTCVLRTPTRWPFTSRAPLVVHPRIGTG